MAKVPFTEALMAMIAMLVVLIFVLIFYCAIPIYRAYKRRKYERENWWERDPRWNGDKFIFTPEFPKDYQNDKKYSKLACSRTSSVKSGATDKTDIESGTISDGIEYHDKSHMKNRQQYSNVVVANKKPLVRQMSSSKSAQVNETRKLKPVEDFKIKLSLDDDKKSQTINAYQSKPKKQCDDVASVIKTTQEINKTKPIVKTNSKPEKQLNGFNSTKQSNGIIKPISISSTNIPTKASFNALKSSTQKNSMTNNAPSRPKRKSKD